jgi:hypothetical protein
LQAFYKGKVFFDIYKASQRTEIEELLQLDFFLAANTLANRILLKYEDKEGIVDFVKAEEEWNSRFPELLAKEVARYKELKEKKEETIIKAAPG